MSRLLLVTAGLVACMGFTLAAPAPGANAPTTGRGSAGVPSFPDLLPLGYPNRSKWNKLGKNILWKLLVESDLDFVDDKGMSVPPGFVNASSVPQSPHVCGRIARQWIRMPFHDCGTYDTRTKKGGCNGSLRKELPGTMPIEDDGTVIEDVFDTLGADKKRADFAFDERRVENTGFAISVSFFYQAKFEAEKFGLYASWADVMVYGGLLSLAMCNGPLVLFVPGREDSKGSDGLGLLPAPSAGLNDLLDAFQRMGLGSLDGMVLQSSHTCACFTTGCLDNTPSKYDNAWAKELAHYNPKSHKAAPICDLTPDTVLQQAHCIAPFDFELTKSPLTRSYLKLMATDTQSYTTLLNMTVKASGKYGYGGFLENVNLCTMQKRPKVCPKDQYAYFMLSSSSWFRLTSLGLPKSWPGHKYAVKKPGMPKEFGLPVPAPDGAYPDFVDDTVREWQDAYKVVQEVLQSPHVQSYLGFDLKSISKP